MKKRNLEIINNSDTQLLISFSYNQKIDVLKNVLDYIDCTKKQFYYFLFRNKNFNVDLVKFQNIYEALKWDYGFIRLNENDIQNYQFISDIFDEYQIASLYINEISDLNENYNYDDIFSNSSSFGGYIISDMKDDYIRLHKDSYFPDWDLSKMGICIDKDYKISDPADTPFSFKTQWQNDNIKIRYNNLQTSRKKILTGILSINEVSFPEYRMGGPFLWSSSFLLLPVYTKIFLNTICMLARIDLSDFSINMYGKGYPMIYLEQADDYRAFFYIDINKKNTDFIKMPKIGKLIIQSDRKSDK